MTALGTFAWGFAGSAAVEIVVLLGFYYSKPIDLPERYRRVGFWITRLTLACMAGALAVGYNIEQKILAFNIGAATPLIITSLARGFRLGAGGLDRVSGGAGREGDVSGRRSGRSDSAESTEGREMREKTNTLVGVALMFALVGLPASTGARAAGTQQAQADQRMKGMVERVQLDEKVISVITGTGHSLRTIVFHVDRECRIRMEGKTADLADVKRGQVVVVLYRETAGGCEAQSIDAAPISAEETRR